MVPVEEMAPSTGLPPRAGIDRDRRRGGRRLVAWAIPGAMPDPTTVRAQSVGDTQGRETAPGDERAAAQRSVEGARPSRTVADARDVEQGHCSTSL
jgi:hypothetical protein